MAEVVEKLNPTIHDVMAVLSPDGQLKENAIVIFWLRPMRFWKILW